MKTTSITPIGVRIIGRCFLPFQTKERVDGGYDILFHCRSNFGGLRKLTGFGIQIEYQKKYKQYVLKIKNPQEAVEAPFPLKIVNHSFDETGIIHESLSLELVKPNKHYLKNFGRSISCERGVLRVPILLKKEDQIVVEGLLRAYPSVIKGKEFLVLDVLGLAARTGR